MAVVLDESAEAEIVAALSSPEWRKKSTLAVAKGLHLSKFLVYRLRRKYGLAPKELVDTAGRTRRRGLIGRRLGKSLSEKERTMIAQLVPAVEKLCRREVYKQGKQWGRNILLDYSALLSAAHMALIVAVRKWDPDKQPGNAKGDSKWKAYASNGVKIAFRRLFHREKQKLQRTALTGNHPYQTWFVRGRLVRDRASSIDGAGENFGPVGSKAKGDSMDAEVEVPASQSVLYERFLELEEQDRIVAEGIAGLDGRPPWNDVEVAEFFGVGLDESREMIARAKAAMME